jgi:hypothetical protein
MNPDIWTLLANTPVRTWVVASPYVWPALESIHFASLCVLMGSLLVVDLRLIGFYRQPCAPTVRFLIRLSIAAFAVNLATGLLFFLGNTFKYVDNPAFELKLVLIAIAGLNALLYRFRLSHIVESDEVSPISVGVGCLSLLLWSGVIVCGRMITFYAP